MVGLGFEGTGAAFHPQSGGAEDTVVPDGAARFREPFRRVGRRMVVGRIASISATAELDVRVPVVPESAAAGQ